MRLLGSLFIAVALLGPAAWSSAQTERPGASTLPTTFTDAALGMEFVLVTGGCFEMGDTVGDGDNDERPLHEVCVNDFYLGRYEVTNAQFKRFVDAAGYRTTAEVKGSGWGFDHEGSGDAKERNGLNWRHPLWPADGIEKKMQHPVVQVTWYDAKELAAWLSRKNNRTVRLPYEAEWEYAARSGGKDHRYSWGAGTPDGNVADLQLKKIMPKIEHFPGYDDGYRYTAPVGSYARNDLGLFDMTGNVWEWCEDWYGSYSASPQTDPTGPATGISRAWRGGSSHYERRACRSAMRFGYDPGGRDDLGLRLARSK